MDFGMLPSTPQNKGSRLSDGDILKALNAWGGWILITGSCPSCRPSYCRPSGQLT